MASLATKSQTSTTTLRLQHCARNKLRAYDLSSLLNTPRCKYAFRTSAPRSKRTVVAQSLMLMTESPDFQQVTEPRSIARRKHFPLHLPGGLDPLPCKIQRTPTILRIEMIEYFHELFTVLPWRVVVEEVELRYLTLCGPHSIT